MKKILIVVIALISFKSIYAQDEDDLFNRSVVQYTLQDYIGCIETLQQLLKIDPKRSEAYYNIADRKSVV